jgi:hypothetical protein
MTIATLPDVVLPAPPLDDAALVADELVLPSPGVLSEPQPAPNAHTHANQPRRRSMDYPPQCRNENRASLREARQHKLVVPVDFTRISTYVTRHHDDGSVVLRLHSYLGAGA